MTAATDAKKRRAALAALELIAPDAIIGIGTGSTVNFLIDGLAARPGLVRAAVSSSEGSSARLRAAGVALADLNDVVELDLYIDGADEATAARHLIKG
ncbi:MAG TPA: ribose-5-phosphate isomerase A, partial [Steroidobacteraceae bacterium]|nr:ribose-5-phosphate isomerase A [Steroidobacteraceae bacterium]